MNELASFNYDIAVLNKRRVQLALSKQIQSVQRPIS